MLYHLIEKYKLSSLHIMVLVLGFTGILGKLITLEAIHLVWYRMLIAFITLALFLVCKKEFEKSILFLFLLLSIFFAGDIIIFMFICIIAQIYQFLYVIPSYREI